METKLVQGYFKLKPMTRQDFIDRWKATISDCVNVTSTPADWVAVQAMITSVEEMAGRKWDGLK